MNKMVISEMQMEAAPATPWAKRRAAVSTRIELATLQLCVDRDIDDVTVDEIAAAAGISRRTFYHYFDSIDDIFGEMPRRSLEQMAREFSERPLSETIAQAFIKVMRNRQTSDEERDIRRLTIKVAQRSQAAYFRAVSRSWQTAKEFFERVVAERLRASGQDPEPAPLIATVLLGIIGQVSRESGPGGEFEPDPNRLEEALHTVAKVLSGLDEA